MHKVKGIVILSVLLMAAIGLMSMLHVGKKPRPAANGGFAVVELFTSEGCSSCPPADEALANIAAAYRNNNVYVLSFHVDYWNSLGWKDAFSDAAYSSRQQQYGDKMNLPTIYTPQAIVNGITEFTGSDKNKLTQAVEAGLHGAVESQVTVTAHVDNDKKVRVLCTPQNMAGGIVNVALVQLHAQSQVQRGENKGRLLNHVNVVRDFKVMAVTGQQQVNAVFNIPAGLFAKDLMVVAYAQQNGQGKITGAGATTIN